MSCKSEYKTADRLVKVFNSCFSAPPYFTRLLGGGEEPLYLPGQASDLHTIVFTRDYFSSALHEVSHWCIAGEQRRKLEDYGYWYAPDGRTPQQQAAFEMVEIRPQALEWIFHKACGETFRVSADNLTANLGASEKFKNNIWQQVRAYCTQGLPQRAGVFAAALGREFAVDRFLIASSFRRREIE